MIGEHKIRLIFEVLQGLGTAAAGRGFDANYLKLTFQNIPVGNQMIDNQRGFQSLRQAKAITLNLFGHRQGDGETKAGAFTLFRDDPNLTAHQLDQLLRDRKAKPGAFKLAVAFIIHLIEFTKDMANLIGGDADAGILDRNMQLGIALIIRMHAHHPDHHMAAFGEFDGIAHQIGHHLTDTARVTNELRRQEEIIIHQQIKPLFTRTGL